MLRAIGEMMSELSAASSINRVRYPLCNGAKLAKRGAPCCVVKCEWNKLVVAYGKVGYLTPIVRYHIKPAHPNRHPTPYTKGATSQ